MTDNFTPKGGMYLMCRFCEQKIWLPNGGDESEIEQLKEFSEKHKACRPDERAR